MAEMDGLTGFWEDIKHLANPLWVLRAVTWVSGTESLWFLRAVTWVSGTESLWFLGAVSWPGLR